MTILENLVDLEYSGEISYELGLYTSEGYISNKKIISELAKVVDKCYNDVKTSESILKLNMFNTYLLISVPVEENDYLFSLGISELIIKFFAKDLELNDNSGHSSLYRFLIGDGIVNYKLDRIYASNSVFRHIDYNFCELIASDIVVNKCEKDIIYIYDKPRVLYDLDCSDVIIHTMLDYFSLQKHNMSNIKNLVLNLYTDVFFDVNRIYTKIKEYIIDTNNYFYKNNEFSFVVYAKFEFKDELSDLKVLLNNIIKDIDIRYENGNLVLRGKTYIIKE